MNDKLATTIIMLRILMFILIMPFFVGVIINYDGANILFHAHNYDSGLLQVDSFVSGVGYRGTSAAVRVMGHVGSVQTGMLLDDADSPSTSARVDSFAAGGLKIPVWYRPDGELTLERSGHEATFPVMRVINEVIVNLLLLNFPFILVLIIHWRYQSKYKKSEKKEGLT
jgi:hypothetical protein